MIKYIIMQPIKIIIYSVFKFVKLNISSGNFFISFSESCL